MPFGYCHAPPPDHSEPIAAGCSSSRRCTFPPDWQNKLRVGRQPVDNYLNGVVARRHTVAKAPEFRSVQPYRDRARPDLPMTSNRAKKPG